MPYLLLSNLYPNGCLREECIAWPFRFGGATFVYGGPEDIIFYDWLRSVDTQMLSGVELRLFDDSLIAPEVVRSLGLRHDNPFYRVWLQGPVESVPLGLEAFGDVEFGTAFPNYWLMSIGLNEWIQPLDIAYLKSLFTR